MNGAQVSATMKVILSPFDIMKYLPMIIGAVVIAIVILVVL